MNDLRCAKKVLLAVRDALKQHDHSAMAKVAALNLDVTPEQSMYLDGYQEGLSHAVKSIETAIATLEAHK